MASPETIYQIAESERKVFVPLSADAAKKKERVRAYAIESGLAKMIGGKLMTKLNRGKPIEYKDSMNWCSVFTNWVAMKAGVDQSNSIAARSWRQIGESVKMKDAKRGDVVVFWRKDTSHSDWGPEENKKKGWKGHVGFFVELVGKDKVKVLGGNQSDTIKESTYDIDGKGRGVLGVRRLAPAGLRNRPVRDKPAKLYYVAPDPPKGKPFNFDHINTLAVKPRYRLSLRLGNVDALFPESLDKTKDIGFTNTDGTATTVTIRPGLKARLQVAGLFPRPLSDANSDECLHVVWKHIREELLESLELAYDDTIVKQASARGPEQRALDLFRPGGIIEPYMIEGGRIPSPSKTAKVRLPGGYTFFNNTGMASPQNPGEYFELGDDRFAAEAQHYKDNPVLGKLPLVAQVEKRVGKDEWKPAERVAVYFQLVKPDAQDPANLRNSSTSFFKPDPGDSGPFAYVKKRNPDYQNTDADDPQAGNAHFDFGGKRGMGMDGTRRDVWTKKQITVDGDGGWIAASSSSTFDWENIFAVEETKGFNIKHDDRDLPHKPYPVAEAPKKDAKNPTHHVNAVKALTNEEGEAGVIFMPSTVGGDVYKLQVYIGPATLQSTGAENDAIVVETGNMERWRTIRLSRYLRFSPSGKLPDDIQEDFDAYNKGIMKKLAGNTKKPLYNDEGALGTVDMTGQVRRECAKSFCEYIIEPRAKSAQNIYTISGFEQAYKRTLAHVKKEAPGLGIALNIDKLMYYSANSPFTANIATPMAYNTAEKTAPMDTDHIKKLKTYREKFTGWDGKKYVTYRIEDTDKGNVSSLLDNLFLPQLFKEIDDNRGYLPGLILVQMSQGDTYTAFFSDMDLTTSGLGTGWGYYLWYGQTTYSDFPYNLSSNALHEMGHCLYFEHQNDEDPSINSGMGHADPQDLVHDLDDRCVMSYMPCEGEYCGNCVCALRGMRTRTPTFVNA